MLVNDQARVHKDKAAELAGKGKLKAAHKEIVQALALAPLDAAARKRSAELLVKLDRPKEAIAEYERLANQFATAGHLPHAIAIGKLILQLDAEHTRTQEMLARLYSNQGKSSTLSNMPAIAPSALGRSPAKPAPREPSPREFPNKRKAERVEIEVPITIEVDEEEIAKLPKTPLFSELTHDLFLAMLEELEMRNLPAGEVIIREGDVGHSMFVLSNGAVKVVRNLGTAAERTVAEMGEGAFFGEIGLLSDVPRLASVVASDDCWVLEITREKLASLTRKHPTLDPVLQHFYRERLLDNLLRSNPLFATFDEASRLKLMDQFTVLQAAPDSILIKEGVHGEALFVLLRGSCEAFHLNDKGKEHPYPSMHEGAIFGEISLLRGCVASASVRASGACLLLALGREPFRQHLLANPAAKATLEKLSDVRLQRTFNLIAQLEPAFSAWL